MKVIAYYLPQFHEIKENNEWWGQGFTEWTNVKKGKPLFHGHQQPKVPMDGYYCLLEKETMLRQAKQANENGIYGMAFYHYWFSGRKLLEKPAENLLKWIDIPMNFMFFWANHNWVRSWNGTKELLIEQTYGEEDEWREHFMYMLPFFKDDRYIRIKGKPAFGVYASGAIPRFGDMIQYWDQLAKENGLEGVYIIETQINPKAAGRKWEGDAVTLRQPNIAQYKLLRVYEKIKQRPKLQKWIPFCYPARVSYKAVMDELIRYSKEYKTDKDLIYGFFTGWDNTSRHGKRGFVITGQTPELFKRYLKELNDIANKKGVEYCFLNAWNEWGEGMVLEPEKADRGAYLNAVKESLS